MLEAQIPLPLTDAITEIRSHFDCRLIEPDMNNPKHVEAVNLINMQSAEEGQLNFDGERKPLTAEEAREWASGELGDFRFTQRILHDRHYRIIGEVHTYADTHIDQLNQLLGEGGQSLTINPEKHTEMSSFIMKYAHDSEMMDEQASLLQLIDLFKLDQSDATPDFETVVFYMDGVTGEDRAMAARLGYTTTVEDVQYEDGLAIAFIATRESAIQAVQNWAQQFGITSGQTSGTRL